MSIQFSITIDDLTLQSCANDLSVGDPFHTTAKITALCEDDIQGSFVIARWAEDELRFVGSRPFKHNPHTFMTLASIGQNLLDQYLLDHLDKE